MEGVQSTSFIAQPQIVFGVAPSILMSTLTVELIGLGEGPTDQLDVLVVPDSTALITPVIDVLVESEVVEAEPMVTWSEDIKSVDSKATRTKVIVNTTFLVVFIFCPFLTVP
jgi:hypothetical protein